MLTLTKLKMRFSRILDPKAVKQGQEEEEQLKEHEHSGHSGTLTTSPLLPGPAEGPGFVPTSFFSTSVTFLICF